jgi:hypothetical protein
MFNVAVDEIELLALGFGHLQKVLIFTEGLSGPHSLPKEK